MQRSSRQGSTTWTVGVIGTGSFGQKRVRALLSLTGLVQKIFVYDQDQAQVRRVVAELGSPLVHPVSELDQLLHLPELQAVFICTPNALHGQLCQQALSRGMHVLCEKPITTERCVAVLAVETARKQQLMIKTGTNHRFFPSIKVLLTLLESGQLGAVHSIHASIGSNGERIKNSWFWKKELSGGGAMLDHGHHLLDLALICAGEFSECVAHTSKRVWLESQVEDYALAVFEQAPTVGSVGCEALLRASWRQPDGYLEFEVWGSKGSAKATVGETEVLYTYLDGQKNVNDFTEHAKTSMHEELQTFFMQCAAPERYAEENYQHILQLTSMIESFYHAARTGSRQKVGS